MNSSAKGTGNFFQGPQRCLFWGSLNTRHMMTVLDTHIVLIPKMPFSLVLKLGVRPGGRWATPRVWTPTTPPPPATVLPSFPRPLFHGFVRQSLAPPLPSSGPTLGPYRALFCPNEPRKFWPASPEGMRIRRVHIQTLRSVHFTLWPHSRRGLERREG